MLPLWVMWSCDNHVPQNAAPKSESDREVAEQLKSRSSYDSAIVFFTKAADYSLGASQYGEWALNISGIIDCYRSQGEVDMALKIVEQAQSVASSKMDTVSNIYNGLIHKKALLYSDKRQFGQATTLFNRNIKVYLSKSGVPDTCLALTYNGLGTVYYLQNKLAEALKEYQKAVETYEKINHTKSPDYANSNQNVGIIYSETGNYVKAEQYFLRSLKTYQDIFRPDNPKLASLYLNVGYFYLIVRNDSKALEYMKRAENFYIAQNQSNSINAGLLFLNMAGIYIYTADYEKAQSYLDKSLEIISVKDPGNKNELQTIYLNMGFIAEKKGQYAVAKEYYLKGLSIGDRLKNTVKVLRGLANVSYKLSDQQDANTYYKAALQTSIEMNGGEHSETALAYLRYGDFLSATGNTQALFYLEKSLDLYKKAFGQVNIDVSTAYHYIGNYHYRAHDYSQALEYFQLSLIAGFPGFTSAHISDNPEITKDNLNENILNPLTAKATALLLQYQRDTTKTEYLKSSTATFSLSLKMIEMLRSSYQDEDSKLFLSGNEKNTFSNALLAQVKLYVKTHSPEALAQAFSLSEKGKSAVLLSHLRDKEAKNIGRIPPELLARDASLKSELYFYNKRIHDLKLAENPDLTKIKMWNSRIFDLSRKQDELVKSIEKDFPVYYKLKYDNSVISVSEIQKRLTPKQAIVEYTLTDSLLFVFVITQGEKRIVTTAIDTSFAHNLVTIRQQIAGKAFNNYSGSDFKAFTQASFGLYKILLLPVQSLVKGKELVIIPDGELGYLSFDVLLTSLPETTKQAYHKLPYLIKESAISYAPSATTFFDELSVKRQRNNGRILAIGPDYGADNAVLDQKSENGNLLRSVLSSLLNAQEEIKILSEYFKVKTYIGTKATETAFKTEASDYRVLHLAMHTVINNENPLYSKLIFFKPKGDTLDDGMLNASELINMELHADMAVLSACNTGSGKMRKGEGIMSLARDFFYAGVPGVVMTAWPIEDRSGVKLMEYFYKNIALGTPRNEALRKAKMEYLEKCDNLTAHPHYWAAYMNVGDISPIKGFGKKTSSFPFYSIAASLIAIAILILFRLHKNQKGNTHVS